MKESRNGHRTLRKLLASLCIAATLLSTSAFSAELRPFVARYRVSFHGIGAGVLEFTLTKGDSPGAYSYSVRAEPSILARLVVSSQALEVSDMQVTNTEVHPLQYKSDDGSKSTAKDTHYDFDWEHLKVTGNAEDKTIDITLVPRTQDRQSIQIAVMNDLIANREPGVYPLLDGDEIKNFSYEHDGAGKIKTTAGEYDAIIMRSMRVGNDRRISRYWHAPSLNFVPVHAERTTKGSVDLVLDLESVKMTPDLKEVER